MTPGTAAESFSDEKTLEVPPVNRTRNPFSAINPTNPRIRPKASALAATITA